MRWIVGISGASGTIYAKRLLEVLAEHRPDIALDVVISNGAARVFLEEDGIELGKSETAQILSGRPHPNLVIHSNKDTGACIASGSYKTDGMVIVPCSMNTVASIAAGLADNLLKRAADVILKERRPLIVVPRESPLNQIHLRNLLTLSQAGASIVPAMPGFYSKPKTVDDLVNHMVMRLLDQMGIEIPISKRWGEG
jgi:polyprenyl P-hydroxybenzoate/phenylacrylic acid decarboxylase-like protein